MLNQELKLQNFQQLSKSVVQNVISLVPLTQYILSDPPQYRYLLTFILLEEVMKLFVEQPPERAIMKIPE